MNEAAFSITTKFYDMDGAENSVTFRADTIDKWGEAMRARNTFAETAVAKGWTTKPPAKAASAPVSASNEGKTPHFVPSRAPNGNATPKTNGDDGDHTFEATRLKVEFTPNGKKAGKLCGGQFTKFGVTVWPEVASELGIDLDNTGPGEYEVGPMTVRYAVNEQGKSQKVIGLAGTHQASAPKAQAKAASAGNGLRVVQSAPQDGETDDSVPF